MDNPITAQLQEAWSKFMAVDHQRPAGLDVYSDIFSDGWLYPLQRMNETAVMIRLARSLNPRNVMEIGSDKGGGFYHWIKGLPSVRKAVAIEYSGVPFADAFRYGFPNVDFSFIHGSSYARDTVAQVLEFMGGGQMFDCIFIDGDKSKTRADFEAYVGLVRPGGLVFIHDVEASVFGGVLPNPSQAFYDLRSKYALSIILDGREGVAAQDRAAANKPLDSSWEDWLRIWKWNSCGVGVVHI